VPSFSAFVSAGKTTVAWSESASVRKSEKAITLCAAASARCHAGRSGYDSTGSV
jgi:hypothetical protein